ncbi:MAG: cupin domain-containing protein [Legionellaceae bacterium]|nr:cupin domain-containing protein [Legionellaceae bacterium]
MVHFQHIDQSTFLTDYWQKKPLVIRQALPDFINPLTADELAGLAMEEDVESRMVLETPQQAPFWHLKTGPFLESDFATLPKTHWTLLVQSMDRLIPEVALMLDHFNFIPQWRVDDVMISYAVAQGSVGPHYDNYDVFLYQASGRRKWSLTTKNCTKNNCLRDVELRIMADFETEEEYVLEAGDMLYLPPHVGHYGVSLSDDCMTYSFGYRSYQGQELWDSFGDFISEKALFTALYHDPNWATLPGTSAITSEAWLQARHVMQQMLDDDCLMKTWFGCFATRLDQQAEQHMPMPLDNEDEHDVSGFMNLLSQSRELQRDATCRLAYLEDDVFCLFINGCEWNITGVSSSLVQYVANNRILNILDLMPYLEFEDNRLFLHELWTLQWLQPI